MTGIASLVRSLIRHLREYTDGRSARWRYVMTDDLPDPLASRRVYLVGEDGKLWYAAMLCPCDCGAMLHMSLHREGKPRWKATLHRDGAISLTPSVWRKSGCRSHFFLRNGRIIWC